MPRGQYPRKAVAETAAVQLPTSAFTDAPWWAKLNSQEQAIVASETP